MPSEPSKGLMAPGGKGVLGQWQRGCSELNASKWVQGITPFMPCVFRGGMKHHLCLTH